MNMFVEAVKNQDTVTENGMKAYVTTTDACLDLFYKIGASRGQNIIPQFVAAFVENKDIALRIAQWARDIRGGAGERDLFRSIMLYLEEADPESLVKVLHNIPEIGRWDDLLIFRTPEVKQVAYSIISHAIHNSSGLCSKWMPRKGIIAVELRKFMGLTPKQYRKLLVSNTKVVETQMCSKDWDNINFSHVPSQASRIYRKAFDRNTKKFAEYVSLLASGDKSVKVNANAIYPHDVLRECGNSYGIRYLSETERNHIIAQWDALPNYVGSANILPMVDVSGSMTCLAGNSSVQCIDIAVSLGLYLSDKNKGAFKDTFLTFSSEPELLHLKGNIIQKLEQMNSSAWGMSTNICSAFQQILNTAVSKNVPQSDMPSMVLILSDMQFDMAVESNDTAMHIIKKKYAEAGYEIPQIVFWNLNSYKNVPVQSHESGAALVSGFSPSILESILKVDSKDFTPVGVMLNTVMVDRYKIN